MSTPEDPKTIIDREHASLERVVHEEIRKQEASVYWRGLVTAPLASEDDFDRKKMIEDYAPKFPHLHRDVIGVSSMEESICSTFVEEKAQQGAIPDDYEYMDAGLQEVLRLTLDPELEALVAAEE